MKKQLLLLSFLICAVIGFAQQRPAGLPSPNSTGYGKIGYQQADSGFIQQPRDTFPAKYPTLIRWSGDNTYWQTMGGTGARWYPVSSGSLRSIYAGFGLTKINDSTISADTALLATRLRVQKAVDSLGVVKQPYNANTTILGNTTTGSGGTIVLSGSPTLTLPSISAINVSGGIAALPTGSGTLAYTSSLTPYKLISDTLFNGGYTTRNTTKKIADSLAALISAGGFGTVMNVATTDGVGIISSVANPTDNANISIRVDTNTIATRLRVQKGIDSLGVIISTGDAAKLNISDTAAMLTPNYRRTITKITNSDLVNSTISGTALGSNLPALSFGTYLQNSATSYNGTTANTISTNATSSNIGSTLVARDINGDFAARNISGALLGNASSSSTVNITNDNSTNATMYPLWSAASSGTNSPKVSSTKITFNPSTGVLTSNFTGALTGNATTASTLQTARTINGVAFDGSADISISASVDSSLSAGYGITGSPFNGSLGRTWVVDTTKIIPYTDTLASYGIASKSFVRSFGYGTGSVTSVATNNASGITGGTIATTGTLAIDTSIIATRLRVQKGIDSISALIPSVSGTSTYIPKFTGTNSIGNSAITDDGTDITLISRKLIGVTSSLSSSSSGTSLEILKLSNNGSGANTKAKLQFASTSTNYASISGGYGISQPELNFDIATGGVFSFSGGTVSIQGDLGVTGLTSTNSRMTVNGAADDGLTALNVLGKGAFSGSVTADSVIKSGATNNQLLAGAGGIVAAGTNITISGGVISASGGGSGSVTSVATNTGSGITGGTITTTGTLAIDTVIVATRPRVQKGIDSLGVVTVHTTGNETIAGLKSFTSNITSTGFVKSGASSVDILLGDGSLATNGYGINLSLGTLKADTVLLATRLRVQKGLDSVAALIPNVSGYKLISDTLFNGGYTTRNTTKKIADSLGAVISSGLALKVNISDTATMLTNYRTGIIALNADTATLAARFTNQTNLANSKVAISDTSAMLSGYKTYYPRAALSAGTGISYNVSTGVITNTSTSSGGTVTSIATDATMQGGTITTSGTLKVDTVIMATRLRVQKGIDSLGAIVATKGSGTVTSVATNNGSGITGGTITGSGTIAADTTVLSTKANVTALLLGKGVGSVTSVATNTGSGITGGTITSSGTIAADTSVLSTKANVTALLLGKLGLTGGSTITTVGTLSSGSIPYSLLTGTPSIPSVSGTSTYIPKFTGTSTIGNSNITDNGTNISFNSTSLSGVTTYTGAGVIFTNHSTANNNSADLENSNSTSYGLYTRGGSGGTGRYSLRVDDYSGVQILSIVSGASDLTGRLNVSSRLNVNGAADNSLFSLNNGGGVMYTNGLSPNATNYSTNITLGAGTTYILNGGSGITWTLPNPSGNNQMYFIKNATANTLTLNAYAANQIIDLSNATQSSISIAAGEVVIIQQDGNAKSYILKQ